MIVELNLDELLQMASLAIKSAEEVTASSNIANTLALHTEWYCPEREQLDENILGIKKGCTKLCESFEAFSVAVNLEVEFFTDMFAEEDRDCAGLESKLGECLSMAQGGLSATVPSGSNTKSIISNFTSVSQNAVSMNSLAGMNRGINVVDFSCLAGS